MGKEGNCWSSDTVVAAPSVAQSTNCLVFTLAQVMLLIPSQPAAATASSGAPAHLSLEAPHDLVVAALALPQHLVPELVSGRAHFSS